MIKIIFKLGTILRFIAKISVLYIAMIAPVFSSYSQENIVLFNGTDLEGWKTYGTEKWYVENGEIICESGPR